VNRQTSHNTNFYHRHHRGVLLDVFLSRFNAIHNPTCCPNIHNSIRAIFPPTSRPTKRSFPAGCPTWYNTRFFCSMCVNIAELWRLRLLNQPASIPALGPTQLPIQWVPGTLSLEVRRPDRKADHSPPSSAKVTSAWRYTSTPQIRLHFVVLSWSTGTPLHLLILCGKYKLRRLLVCNSLCSLRLKYSYFKYPSPPKSVLSP
jgi:hypothetical protein